MKRKVRVRMGRVASGSWERRVGSGLLPSSTALRYVSQVGPARVWLCAVVWTLACADSRTPKSSPIQNGVDAATDAAAATHDAGEEPPPEPPEIEIRERKCGFPPFGDEWELAENGQFDCLRQEHCGPPAGRGLCIGEPVILIDCQGDQSLCPKIIGRSSCVFQTCITDGDCSIFTQPRQPSETYACVCTDEPLNFCSANACKSDADCAAGQHCKLDQTALGHPGAPHCTTPDDRCQSDADCSDEVANICGWSIEGNERWECQGGLIVD